MAKKKKEETAVVRWEDEMEKIAQTAAAMEEGVGGGQFFSLKAGQLSWAGSPVPGNEMAVIIIDSILENVFYEGKYDPDVQQGPKCFAFGRDVKSMQPHKVVIEAGNAMSGACEGCELNEWGSADTGKGKACRNTRRLAMLPAGKFTRDGDLELFESEDHFATTEPGFMKLPVTSVKGYASFVTQVASSLKRPPFGVITKVAVIPDPKSQFRVVFQALQPTPDELMPTIMERYKEISATIDFPYQIDEEEAVKPAKKAVSKKARKY